MTSNFHPGFRNLANHTAELAPMIYHILYRMGWKAPLLKWTARQLLNLN